MTPTTNPPPPPFVQTIQDRNGLGLVIGLSKKSSNPDKKQVVFIRALQRRADGTQSEAVRKGEMMPQDVVEAVNGVEVGTDLSVLTKEINKVDIDGPITFRVSRRAKDEERRLKALADQKIALKLNYQLRTIFNMIDTDKSNSLTLAEIDAAGKQIFLDKLGIHLPADIIKNGFASLEQFAEIGDGKISFEEFRGVLYSKELALSSRNTRYAKYAILFKTLDKDASGSIDKDEFLGANDMMKKLFGENGDSIVEEFASADLNNDGQISFEELRNIAEDFYERHLHPDGYEEADSISLTHEEATALIDEHYDEDHTDTVGTPEHLAEIGSVVESAAAAATAAAAAAAAFSGVGFVGIGVRAREARLGGDSISGGSVSGCEKRVERTFDRTGLASAPARTDGVCRDHRVGDMKSGVDSGVQLFCIELVVDTALLEHFADDPQSLSEIAVLAARLHAQVEGLAPAGLRVEEDVEILAHLGIRLAARARQAAMGGLQLLVPRLEGGCIEIGRDRRLGVLGKASQD